MTDLRQIMSQGRKRIGLFIGAGAPTSVRVDSDGKVVQQGGGPLIPDVAGLTSYVVGGLEAADRSVLESIKSKLGANPNIEALLTQVRRLAVAIGAEKIHGLDGAGYDALGQRITVLDLSGVPSGVLEQLIGAILMIVYDSLFWSREKTEGGIDMPLLIVMEEAHRYLATGKSNLASLTVQKIAKEGRKYGVGAMVISQRPSEVDETILSQCGTFFALRLANPVDRSRIQGTLPDGLVSLLDVLPVLRTGEAIVTGDLSKLLRGQLKLVSVEIHLIPSACALDASPCNIERTTCSSMSPGTGRFH
ncbi:hypothetical protein LMTR3_19700 [Bradyrhizobium sp. LMTR 3]|nr:hypothetical protein LMTR3_19700 [Bradyrhizobium sp. LMTR 3]